MEQIAASAGTTKPTLNTRFGDKESLYQRTIRERARALLDHLFASYDQAQSSPRDDRHSDPRLPRVLRRRA